MRGTMGRIKTAEHRQTFFKYKQFKQNSSCFSCGETRYDRLEFHHLCYETGRRTDKFMAVSTMVRINMAWDDVRDEIGKCIVLCKTCHTNYHRKAGYV